VRTSLREAARSPLVAGCLAIALLGAVIVIQFFGWRTRLAFGVSMVTLLALASVIESIPADGVLGSGGQRSLLATAGFALAMSSYIGYRAWLLSSGTHLPWHIVLGSAVAAFTMLRFAVGIQAAAHTRPVDCADVPDDELPTVSICVSCFNEGDTVDQALRCLVLDYPIDRYEVVIVDDGSTDDSPRYIKKAALFLESRGVRVRGFLLAENVGKRRAMALAMRACKSDIVVLVDSDSILARDSLRRLARYFDDPSVGGVSAHADVLNPEESLISRMQVARYYVAFRIIKAGESLFGAVGCLSGCCAAYRRDVAIEQLDAWLGQTFLGRRCIYSDDRALTNLLLRNGYRTVYAPDVRSYTVVPTTLRKFLTQQMRWKRGWIINSIDAARFMWRLHPGAAFFFYGNLVLAAASTVLVVQAFHLGAVSGDLYALGMSALMIVISTLVFGFVYTLFRRDHYWMYGLVWSALFVSVLVLQLPYALVTLTETRWGTR
jgi:hyaluronan synthase